MTDNPQNFDICYLKGVGPKRAELLKKLSVFTLYDVLRYYPRDYQDWSSVRKIGEAPFDEKCCIRATLYSAPESRITRSGATVYTAMASDGRDIIKIIIFNNKYAAERLQAGKDYLFFGKIGGNFTAREMNSPMFEEYSNESGLHAVYPLTAGITSKILSKIVNSALEKAGDTIPDPLPEKMREKYSLCEIKDALYGIHFPRNREMLETAKRRIAFEELLTLQLGFLRFRSREHRKTAVKINNNYSEEFFSMLPFTPTGAQKRAVCDICRDMASGFPMNRLLQGDVGSGKTAVAAAAVYSAVKNGWQCALMVPTGVLAEQHYNTFVKMFDGRFKIALLTGTVGKKAKSDIYERLKSGEIDLVIGTHAVIEEKVSFLHLGLVITDEQHRFGVKQRAALAAKGENPHMLVMSATPIPRSLSLIIYGDLELSVLDEMPPSRRPVATYAIESGLRERAFNYVKKHLDAGYQGFIVCPLVEDDEDSSLGLAAAGDYAKKLQATAFKGYSVGLIHGKMKPRDKESAMADFAAGKINLLVATTVIEVGIDVPNAVIMVIENAERFGLSQLHQLRGRVGRGKVKSTCILISDAGGDDAVKRLSIMKKTSDGFKIAEEDLKLRGPGDFFGSRQHGLPRMAASEMLSDSRIIELSRDAARELYAADPLLELPENAGIRESVKRFFQTVEKDGFN